MNPLFEFASLGSGSSGNATLVRAGRHLVLVDCGFGLKETQHRLLRLGVSGAEITAILVTHEHGDHIKGVGAFARKFNTPVYATPGTSHAQKLGRVPHLHLLEGFRALDLAVPGEAHPGSEKLSSSVAEVNSQLPGVLRIQPVAVPHDAREPAQFILQYQGLRLGILTDLGHISQHVQNAYAGCDALLLEANHCLDMLNFGDYPRQLKRRVAGQWGHLNNAQSAAFLKALDTDRLKTLVLGHISRNNNSLERVKACFAKVLSSLPLATLRYACQDEGFNWLSVTGEHAGVDPASELLETPDTLESASNSRVNAVA